MSPLRAFEDKSNCNCVFWAIGFGLQGHWRANMMVLPGAQGAVGHQKGQIA